MRTRPKMRGNPLRRGSDRVQWWLGHVLLAVAVLALPVAALAGLATYRGQVHTGQAESATRQPVAARLTADAPLSGADVPNKVSATAGWTAADGTARTSPVQVWPGERAGAPITLWTDTSGAVVAAPVTRGQAAEAGWITAAVTATAMPLVCLTVWRSGLLLLDRRRLAQWDEEWNSVEPRWTRRQPS